MAKETKTVEIPDVLTNENRPTLAQAYNATTNREQIKVRVALAALLGCTPGEAANDSSYTPIVAVIGAHKVLGIPVPPVDAILDTPETQLALFFKGADEGEDPTDLDQFRAATVD